MTNYVWLATDKSGKKVIREIEAATAEDAKFVLLAQGYSNLELKEDEVTSAVLAGFTKRENAFGQEIRVTAEERLKHRDNPTVTYWDALRKGIGRSFIVFLALCILAIYSGLRGDRGHAALYVAGLLGWLGYILFVSLPSVYYRKLIKAGDWSQWNEVLSLVATLQLIGRFSLVKVPATELTRNRAKALAGMVGWMRPWPNIANARAVQIARLGCINCLWLRCTPPPGSTTKPSNTTSHPLLRNRHQPLGPIWPTVTLDIKAMRLRRARQWPRPKKALCPTLPNHFVFVVRESSLIWRAITAPPSVTFRSPSNLWKRPKAVRLGTDI